MLRLPGFQRQIIVSMPLMCSTEPCWRGGAHQGRCYDDLSLEAWQAQHALNGMTSYIVLNDVWDLSLAVAQGDKLGSNDQALARALDGETACIYLHDVWDLSLADALV